MANDNLFLVQCSKNGDGSSVQLGLARGNEAIQRISGHSLDGLLALNAPRAVDLIPALERLVAQSEDQLTLRTPVGQQEIWAAGVTYKRSEEAREVESGNSNLYSRVYRATRPELFFKSNGYDVVGLGDPVGIRADAKWSVPEPELVVVLNAHMEVIGFTVGNDMSSRDIEGENPLYLPQAKVYEAACAIGPRIWLQPGLGSWPDVKIELKIERGGQVAFSGETTTAALHRPLMELVDYLGRCKRFPYGAMLFTGTGIVPPDTFTLAKGDTVSIRIDPIGELVNTVRVVGNT
jgi:2-dehydro-3-deoxy-D-arabinonate dehydratase